MPKEKTAIFMEEYMVAGVPTMYLIDPEGKIYKRNPARPSDIDSFSNLMKEIGLEI